MMETSPLNTLNLLIPGPFKLSEQDPDSMKSIVDEVFQKVEEWETKMSPFFGEMNESANSWRVLPREMGNKRPQGLFNSKSGETNRAVNTLASIWFSMLTASDPGFEAVAEGIGPDGLPISETELFGTEALISKQLEASQYKRKLFKTLRSLATFGTVVIEEPYVIKPNIEYTDFNHRSMLLTAFDPNIFDINESDFICFIDFPTENRMRAIAKTDPDTWDAGMVEKAIAELKNTVSQTKGQTFAQVTNRKQRAGYTVDEKGVNQLVTYHGKLRSDNPILQIYWQSNGLDAQGIKIEDTDWTVSIYGNQIVRLHHTPYGDWHQIAKVAVFNEFELEPMGYGVGKLGKKPQREMDVIQSRLNDLLMFQLFSMFKISKYAGLKGNQFNIKPWNIIELEDITQLEPIRPDPMALKEALAWQEVAKEDFRALTGATTNLQATTTNATATEASLTQTEAMRSASVNAEIFAEPLVRAHIIACHNNNLNLLSQDIYVGITGQNKPTIKGYNRNNLPKNVGFKVRITTDKDYRPERQKNLLQGLQLATSVRNMMPSSANVVRPLLEEWFRSIGVNPRLLTQPVPMADQLIEQARRAQMLGGSIGNEVKGEVADEQSGYPNVEQTPKGLIPVSPVNPNFQGL